MATEPTAAPARRVRPRTPKGRAREVSRRLAETYPDAICELDHRNPFELLAATILSAQTTDARVNMVTPTLFARYPTAADLAAADPADVEEIIKSTGFYANKTKSLIGMANALVERFGGEVPTRLDDLVTIPGVGRKTGNVVRSVAFRLPGLPVDTHVGRLARRLASDRAGGPGEGRAGAQQLPPGRGARRLQPAHDPPRPAGLLRPEAGVRTLLAGGHLPVEPAAEGPPAPIAPASTTGRRVAAVVRRSGRMLASYPGSDMLDVTNQVPATWFAATAGIRRLASPVRRPLPPGAVAAFRLRSACERPIAAA